MTCNCISVLTFYMQYIFNVLIQMVEYYLGNRKNLNYRSWRYPDDPILIYLGMDWFSFLFK